MAHYAGAREMLPGAASGEDAIRRLRDAYRAPHREEEFSLTPKKRPGPAFPCRPVFLVPYFRPYFRPVFPAHEPARGVPPFQAAPAPPPAEGRRRLSPWTYAGPPEPRTSCSGPRSTPRSSRAPCSSSSEAPSLRPRVRIQSPHLVGHPAPKRGRTVQFNRVCPAGPRPRLWAASAGCPPDKR